MPLKVEAFLLARHLQVNGDEWSLIGLVNGIGDPPLQVAEFGAYLLLADVRGPLQVTVRLTDPDGAVVKAETWSVPAPGPDGGALLARNFFALGPVWFEKRGAYSVRAFAGGVVIADRPLQTGGAWRRVRCG